MRVPNYGKYFLPFRTSRNEMCLRAKFSNIHVYVTWKEIWCQNSVKKVPGIDHLKSPFKEIVKNLFDAKFAPLSSILTWSSSAICHLVCSQCSMLSVYLKCASRFLQWIIISNKEFVSNFALKMESRVRNRWKCYRRRTVNRLYWKHVHMSGTPYWKILCRNLA